jgi:hypothetical protein
MNNRFCALSIFFLFLVLTIGCDSSGVDSDKENVAPWYEGVFGRYELASIDGKPLPADWIHHSGPAGGNSSIQANYYIESGYIEVNASSVFQHFEYRGEIPGVNIPIGGSESFEYGYSRSLDVMQANTLEVEGTDFIMGADGGVTLTLVHVYKYLKQ